MTFAGFNDSLQPFAIWERGIIEKLNGLMQQYIPEKKNLSAVTDEENRIFQNKLKKNPRKNLSLQNPQRCFISTKAS